MIGVKNGVALDEKARLQAWKFGLVKYECGFIRKHGNTIRQSPWVCAYVYRYIKLYIRISYIRSLYIIMFPAYGSRDGLATQLPPTRGRGMQLPSSPMIYPSSTIPSSIPQPSLWVQAGPLFPHGRTWMQSPHSIPYEANHDSMTITDRGEKYHMLRTYQKPLLYCGRNIPTGLVPFLWTTWSCPTQLPTVNQMLN